MGQRTINGAKELTYIDVIKTKWIEGKRRQIRGELNGTNYDLCADYYIPEKITRDVCHHRTRSTDIRSNFIAHRDRERARDRKTASAQRKGEAKKERERKTH